MLYVCFFLKLSPNNLTRIIKGAEDSGILFFHWKKCVMLRVKGFSEAVQHDVWSVFVEASARLLPITHTQEHPETITLIHYFVILASRKKSNKLSKVFVICSLFITKEVDLPIAVLGQHTLIFITTKNLKEHFNNLYYELFVRRWSITLQTSL